MNVYSEYNIYGPYINKKSKRQYIQLSNNFTKKRKTMQYARFLYQKHNNCILPSSIHIHHIDGNPHNNNITNLQAVNDKDHFKQTGLSLRKYKEKKTVYCLYCSKEFELTRKQQTERTATEKEGGNGPFCSVKCRVTFNNLNSKNSVNARSKIDEIKKAINLKIPTWKISVMFKVSNGFIYNVRHNKLKHIN